MEGCTGGGAVERALVVWWRRKASSHLVLAVACEAPLAVLATLAHRQPIKCSEGGRFCLSGCLLPSGSWSIFPSLGRKVGDDF